MERRIKVKIDDNPIKKGWAISIDKEETLFMGVVKMFKKYYHGIIDINERVIIPFSENEILEIFHTNDENNFCINRKINNETWECFHIVKEEEDYNIKLQTSLTEPLHIVPSENDNYWLLESTINEEPVVALYDIKKRQPITPFFTEILFDKEENSRILASVERDLYDVFDEHIEHYTSLISYIDENGKFIAPILETEKELYYASNNFNLDPEFKLYNQFVHLIKQQYQKEYREKNERINLYLSDMYYNPYSNVDIHPHGKPAKIIKFKEVKK